MAHTVQRLRDLAADCETENTRLVGHHDLHGVGDAMQIIVRDGFAYVAHVGYNGPALPILDVSDPENPELVRQIPKSKNAHSHKVQIVGNILIQNSECLPYVKRADDDPPECGEIVYNLVGSFVSEEIVFSTWFNAGVRIHDISNPDRPEEVGFFHPPAPPGEPIIQLNDLHVDSDRLCYAGDRMSGGLYIAEYTGPVR